jgi:hypothetical protein
MKIIASENFKHPTAVRPVRAGEVIETTAAAGRKLLKDGFAIPIERAAELAIRKPKESR